MNFSKEEAVLYAVTDRSWLNGSTLYDHLEQALKGGVTCVQLREKQLNQAEFIREAGKIKDLCARYHVPLIINDSVDVALAVDADGVHVGQKDMEAGEARRRLGPGKIIGVSARTVEQAVLAEKTGADYLGAGAVFHTASKSDACPLDHAVLRHICEAVRIPVVAIGGISRDNILQLAHSGVSGVAVISGIFAQKNIERAAAQMRMLSEKMLAE